MARAGAAKAAGGGSAAGTTEPQDPFPPLASAQLGSTGKAAPRGTATGPEQTKGGPLRARARGHSRPSRTGPGTHHAAAPGPADPPAPHRNTSALSQDGAAAASLCLTHPTNSPPPAAWLANRRPLEAGGARRLARAGRQSTLGAKPLPPLLFAVRAGDSGRGGCGTGAIAGASPPCPLCVPAGEAGEASRSGPQGAGASGGSGSGVPWRRAVRPAAFLRPWVAPRA